MKTMDCTPIDYGKIGNTKYVVKRIGKPVVDKRPAVQRTNRAITVRCITCGLEVTGVTDNLGQVRPHDRARPELDAPVEDGYCWLHVPGGVADHLDLDRRSR